jgi:hypothetical protein
VDLKVQALQAVKTGHEPGLGEMHTVALDARHLNSL